MTDPDETKRDERAEKRAPEEREMPRIEVSSLQILGTPEQVAQLFAAFVKAKGAFKEVLKRRSNPFFGSKYADLADVFAAVDEALAANGLALIQPTGRTTTIWEVRTIIIHQEGGRLETVAILPSGGDWQKTGSAITYCRRYCAAGLLGVASEDDDDGNAASDAQPREQKRPQATPPKVEKPAARAPEKAAAKPVEQSAPSTPAKAAEPTLPGVDTSQKAPDALVGENARPASVPPPAETSRPGGIGLPPAEKQMAPGEPASPPEVPPVGLTDKVTAASTARMKALIAELVPPVGTNGQTRGDWVREWCVKVLGKPTDKVTLEAEIQVLIADLEMRKAAV